MWSITQRPGPSYVAVQHSTAMWHMRGRDSQEAGAAGSSHALISKVTTKVWGILAK